eukprot:scaffold3068_cov401-Prasinococcus_capsulatus_cf.AAC.5
MLPDSRLEVSTPLTRPCIRTLYLSRGLWYHRTSRSSLLASWLFKRKEQGIMNSDLQELCCRLLVSLTSNGLILAGGSKPLRPFSTRTEFLVA